MKLNNKQFNAIVESVVKTISDRYIITPKALPIEFGLTDSKLLDLILKVVVEHYGITIEQIKSRRRALESVIPRQVYMWLAREFKTKTMSDAIIAGKVNLSRANAINQPKNLDNIIEVDKQLYSVILMLRNDVNEKIKTHSLKSDN